MEEIHPPPSSSSSSSSSSSISQKSIYLWYRVPNSMNSGKKSTWYKLDPAQLKYEDSELTHIWEGDLYHATTAVAWGPTIYVIAGNSKPRIEKEYPSYDENNKSRTNEVYYLDTRRSDLGWKTGPALLNSRSEVQITVRNGKIYAFGGGFPPPKPERGYGRGRARGYYPSNFDRDEDDSEEQPPDANFGEVLDPLMNNWGLIAGPDNALQKEAEKKKELYVERDDVSMDLHDEALVEISYRQYRYGFDSCTWGLVPHRVSKKNRAAIIGDIMYRVNPFVRAYDVKNGRELKRYVKGLNGKSVSPPVLEHDYEYPASIVDIGGGKLCMLWESEKGTHCTKFRVSVHDDGEGMVEVLATIEAFRIFCTPWKMNELSSRTYLKDCLAL